MKKVVWTLAVLVVIIGISIKQLYRKEYIYNISEQKEILEQIVNEQYAGKYKIYTAAFNEKDQVPQLKANEKNTILWLGRKPVNFMQERYNLQKFGLIICADYDKITLLKMLGIKAYQFPEFTKATSINKKQEQYYALLENPLYTEEYLKQNQIPFKNYTFKDIKKIKQDLPNIKAIIIADDNKGIYNMEPVFLNMLLNEIPIVENKLEHKTSSESLVGQIVEYYYNQEELKDIIDTIENNKDSLRRKNNAQWVKQHFTKEVAEKRLDAIINNKKVQFVDENTIDIDIQNVVGFHPFGDEWLASDLKSKLNVQNKYYIAFYDSPYRPTTPIEILLVGGIKGALERIVGEKKILWLAYPHANQSDSKKTFKEYMDEIIELSNLFKKVAVSSKKMQSYMDEHGIEAEWIPQFTNTDKFYPDYDETKKSEILFVGNYAESKLTPITAKKRNFPVTIYGTKWPEGWAKANYVDNRILRKYYSSAKIVLSDQNKYMTDFGVIVNRIFDATACNTLVVSKYVEEVEQVYGNCVPMWKTEEELVDILNYYLSHDEERKQKAKCAMDITLENFTADKIAKKIDKLIEELQQEDE